MRHEAGARLEAVVRAVCLAACADASATGMVITHAEWPEGELLAGWLADAGDGLRVWRETGAAGHVLDERRAGGALVAHPASKTALLLSPRLPLADLLPLGDVWASQVAELAGGWSGTPELRRLADAAGGIAALDRAMQGLVEERQPAATALRGLPARVADEVLTLYEAGRHARLRPRLTPKLTARTLGIDLFD